MLKATSLYYLLDGGLSNEDIKDLCFEALQEIIPAPGLKGVVLRSRIWKVTVSWYVAYFDQVYKMI